MKTLDKLEDIFLVYPGDKVEYKGYTIQVTYHECDGEIVSDLPGGWRVWQDGMVVLNTESYNDLILFLDEAEMV